MNEYRITRPALYTNPNCPGHQDKSARQGHYYEGETATDALRKAHRDFPGEALDCELVREGISTVIKVPTVPPLPAKPAEPVLKTPIERATEALEEIAHEMANANNVEGAWGLRGFFEELESMFTPGGKKHAGPDEYRGSYNAGVRAARKIIMG